MKPKKYRAGFAANPALSLLVATGLTVGMVDASLAAEPKPKPTYTKVPMAAYNALMDDALIGNNYEKPVWNLHDALHLPDWLTVGLENRTRYETLSDTFKPSQPAPAPQAGGGNQQITLQTDLWIQAKFGNFRFATEFLDARALLSDQGTNNTPNPPNNTMVDTADFAQAYVSWADQNAFYSGLGMEVKAGRQTLDMGSRRLVSRPIFRNTVNSFTGLKIRVLDYDRWQFNAFGTMPVLRYPNYVNTPPGGDPDLLAANANQLANGDHEWDLEDTQTFFSGGIIEGYDLFKHINAELYLYNLNEGDSTNNPTRNRKYFTPGLRFYIKPSKGNFDFVAEGMGQFGTAQYNTRANNQQQHHQAWSEHIEAGYSFDLPMSPRFVIEYDWASGSKSSKYTPGASDGRFDSLYAATDIDFGSSGIYSAFQRSNINSPGYRINFAPRPNINVALQQRLIWLDSAGDCWGGASCSSAVAPGLIGNPQGTSGSYVGDQLGITSRYNFNSSLNLDAGWFHLFKGEFAKTGVSTATGTTTPGGDTDYFYVQSQMRF
ncbi:MAG: alginate export family protein [Methylococcales bacterium]|nr:alginate export family protein [Methylococcales bacterium]